MKYIFIAYLTWYIILVLFSVNLIKFRIVCLRSVITFACPPVWGYTSVIIFASIPLKQLIPILLVLGLVCHSKKIGRTFPENRILHA